MSGKPRRSGYFYRTSRKISFLIRRGSLFPPVLRSREAGRRDHHIPGSAFTVISINSLFFFLMAYMLMFLWFHFATSLAAYAFGIPSIVYLNETTFMIKGVGWSPDAVKVVYAAGPFASLVAGIVLIIVYAKVAEENGLLRLLVIWMFAHATVFFFGDVMMGSLFGRGFGYVLMYLYAQDTVMMVITVLALIGMIALGFRMARLFAVSANIYFNELPSFYARKFLTFQYLIPFLAGNAVIFAMKLPGFSPYDIALNLTMIFLLAPVLIQASRIEDLYFDEDPRSVRAYAWIAALSLVALAAFRIVFGAGTKLFF